MVFKRRNPAPPVPEDPEQLYRMLAQSNSGPPALWSHQADVLRSWFYQHRDAKDVAVELPTGAGKTLVGGLVAEFQRRAARERVAYLCPTNQLARQTAGALALYGIPTVSLIGKVKTWNPADRAAYTRADAVAVSVYSHVFNSNPALNDVQTLVLDDAHAAESYVAGPWSLEVSRDESAYLDVLSALVPALDPLVVERLRSDTPNWGQLGTVYLAAPVGVLQQAAELEQVLATAAATRTFSDGARHALTFLAGKLDRCLVYASYRSLLFRPLIPPTAVHPAFSEPARRVYMSATLGAGGELERTFGRRAIARIPIPKGWEKQGTGRRLFLFPELTTDLSAAPTEVDAWVRTAIAEHGRAVVLTPDERTAATFIDTRIPAGHTLLRATDVEDDLAAFTAQPRAALVMSNRYDGIDLPDDDCRLVIVQGLPARGDLQERFLNGSLGALEVLQERIRARFVQGSGRATRNARDYATVLVLGSELTSYINRHDVQDAMRPEVHAELAFGYDNSLGITSAEMLERMRVFVTHDATWAEFDADIVADRDRLNQVAPPGTTELQAAAKHEVAAWESIWQGEWERALQLTRDAIDALTGGRAPQRYAALLNYLAAYLAIRLAEQTGKTEYHETSTAFYQAARAAGRGTTWLSHLAAPADQTTPPAPTAIDALDTIAMDNVIADGARIGRPATFETTVTTMRAGLTGTDARQYEAALVTLGRLAGANPSDGNGGADAAPDASWIFGEVTWVAWEAKSEARSDTEVDADDVRQAGSHLRYIATRREEVPPGDSVTLLVSGQERVHHAARAVAEDHVYLVRPSQVVDLCDRLVRAWRTLRSQTSPSISTAQAASIFQAEAALPTQWIPQLRTEPLRNWSSDAE